MNIQNDLRLFSPHEEKTEEWDGPLGPSHSEEFSSSGGELPAGVVDGVFPLQDELGDGYQVIAVLDQRLEDAGQSLWGVEGGIVEQDDGAGLDPGGDPLGDLLGGDLFPVQAVHIPLDGLHADGAGGLDGAVVIVPIGEAHQGGTHAGDGLDLIVAGVEVGHHLLGGELGVVGVGVRVVHHLVSGLMERQDGLGIPLRPVSHHEEGGCDSIVRQDIDELLGVLVAPG